MPQSQFCVCTRCNKKFVRTRREDVVEKPFCSPECCRIWQKQTLKTVLEGDDRKCAKCDEVKPIIAFRSKGKGRIQSYCNQCLYLFQMRRWNDRKRMAIEYLGDVCKKCGRGGHPATFTFHHRDPKEKEFDWNKLRQKSWDKIIKELDKCNLLHGDCHVMEHIKPELWEKP